jgi:rubredoxin
MHYMQPRLRPALPAASCQAEAAWARVPPTHCEEGGAVFKRYLCLGCGFHYDEALGLPEHDIAPGTRWADIPQDWVCADCATPKSLFEMVEIAY